MRKHTRIVILASATALLTTGCAFPKLFASQWLSAIVAKWTPPNPFGDATAATE